MLALAGSGSVCSDEPIRTDKIKTKMAGSGTLCLNLKDEEVSASLAGSGRIELQESVRVLMQN